MGSVDKLDQNTLFKDDFQFSKALLELGETFPVLDTLTSFDGPFQVFWSFEDQNHCASKLEHSNFVSLLEQVRLFVFHKISFSSIFEHAIGHKVWLIVQSHRANVSSSDQHLVEHSLAPSTHQGNSFVVFVDSLY